MTFSYQMSSANLVVLSVWRILEALSVFSLMFVSLLRVSSYAPVSGLSVVIARPLVGR